MSKRETKFNASWSEKYAWISKDKNCIHSARCTLCSKLFSIRNVGISDVNQHSKIAIHVKNEKQWDHSACLKNQNQSWFFNRMFQTYNKRPNLKVETLQTLNMEDKNYSFCSTSGDSDRFKKMVFPLTRVYWAFTDILPRMKL